MRNNFGALRTVAALFVLVGHGVIIGGTALQIPSIMGFGVHQIGLHVFFSISGFLIATSLTRPQSSFRFLVNRFLRIFPGLALVVISWTFIFGPLISTLGTAGYFESNQWQTYLLNLVLFPVYFLPGVFQEGVSVPNAVNGSLWSLPVEVACYLAILLSTKLLKKLKMTYVYPAIALGLALVSVNLASRPERLIAWGF